MRDADADIALRTLDPLLRAQLAAKGATFQAPAVSPRAGEGGRADVCTAAAAAARAQK